MTNYSISSIASLLLYLFYLGLALYFIYDLVFKKHNPVKSLSWIVVMLLLPYVGLIIYLYVGRDFRKNKIYSRKGLHDERLKKELTAFQLEQLNQEQNDLPEDIALHKKLVFLVLNNSRSILTEHNSTQLYYTGKEALEAMYESALNASHHIHLQSFIIENDSVGTRWKNLLMEKALKGVDVCVIYDDFGSWHLPRSFIRDMRDAGVHIEPFGKVGFPGIRVMINYRNHRKLLIVDGEEGFLGGVNIADRYYDGGSSMEWRDTQIRIRGEAVKQLESSFLMDWYFITHKNLRRRRHYSYQLSYLQEDSVPETCYMQIVSSGPDSDWADIMQLYLTIITEARNRISINTPYFIPNESILNALRTAALGGVEVRIMLPLESDARFVHYASLSYVTELLDAGVKVYLYTKGFIHSKTISIDGRCCVIGSANLDNRSLEHHFEVGAIIYNPGVSSRVEDEFDRCIGDSRLIVSRTWDKRPFRHKVYEQLTRLLSPLL
ncbi:MAG TPA: cardiolipin synthase [Bacteroidales bacterium]|jgi:cardiolipin synthase|nr:cardiolipin synthase [Bacteroidales bacterium]OQC58083.1 MAG: Major cardiolipin synthase ClsA [Bacteroidetes bacterium ADurb.Bin013]MBP9000379.1 cardiolipin synthase [Bacteroidales bacterium]HOF76566.1 cardiolipin synthase [Bacteroidales bacterium]HOQ96500.1 cardiolipin synthase [Bacteroidales bacterium]